MVLRIVLCLWALFALTACATTADPKWASDEAVAAARYVGEGPPTLTLYTVVNNRSDAGAHTGLLIDGAERILFDPAGTWHHPRVPERNDVHYGITPKIQAFYIDYHARETFRVIEQRLVVTPEQAAMVAARAKAYGAVPKAQCANSISSILSGVPGFESIGNTWFPNKLMAAFGALPGVTERVITDADADNNHGVLLVQAGAAPL